MPTAGRAAYVAQSIDMFLRQDYAHKELIIVYNKDSDLPHIYYPPSVKLVRAATQILGNKRNEACLHAQGAIIGHWDDDDIYNTGRISAQVAPILNDEADITGITDFRFFEAVTGKNWALTPESFAMIFTGKVAGGSLFYNRVLWDSVSRYPNVKIAEDVGFLKAVTKRGARLQTVAGEDHYIVLRHDRNTWKFEQNNFRRYPCWLETATPEWARRYTDVYCQRTKNAGGDIRPHTYMAELPKPANKMCMPGITNNTDSACALLL